jgi:hypothetical protein
VSSDILPSARIAQARENLKRAQRVRTLRANLWKGWKEKGRSGAALEAAQLVSEPPMYLRSCSVALLLGKIPTIGRIRPQAGNGAYRAGHRLAEWMRVLDIPVDATVGTLTPRRRHALAERLRLYADPQTWEKLRKGL